MTHESKVHFFITEFSSRKIIQHHFHFDSNIGEFVISYDIVIGHDLMVKLGLSDNFKYQVLQWGGVTVPMKEPICILSKSYLTSHDMSGLVMQTAEPVSTREDTEILVKILDRTYVKSDLTQIANNATHLEAEERTQLLMFLKDF